MSTISSTGAFNNDEIPDRLQHRSSLDTDTMESQLPVSSIYMTNTSQNFNLKAPHKMQISMRDGYFPQVL